MTTQKAPQADRLKVDGWRTAGAYIKVRLWELVGPHLDGIIGFLMRGAIHGAVVKFYVNWFIVPFQIIPKVSFSTSMGVYLFVAFMKRDYRSTLHIKPNENSHENNNTLAWLYVMMLRRAFAAFSAGWIVHSLGKLTGF